MCADEGDLSVRNYWIVTRKGGTPFIKPNVTTIGEWKSRKVHSEPYQDMVDQCKRHHEEWLRRFHQRSKTEGVNAAIKRRLGRMLSSASGLFRRIELALRLVTWNLIRLVYKKTVEE